MPVSSEKKKKTRRLLYSWTLVTWRRGSPGDTSYQINELETTHFLGYIALPTGLLSHVTVAAAAVSAVSVCVSNFFFAFPHGDQQTGFHTL